MRFSLASATLLVGTALAARPFRNEADTGIEFVYGNLTKGELPDLAGMFALPDFEWAARKRMTTEDYTYYRAGASGEYSYRNNLEVWQRIRFRPRVLNDVTAVGTTLATSILGNNFSAPFFIAPAARAAYAHPDAERNLVRAAAEANILYAPSLSASLTVEQIGETIADNQTVGWQLYVNNNWTANVNNIRRIEKAGAQVIFMTVDAPGDPIRHRAQRYNQGSAQTGLTRLTWDVYASLQNITRLPIVPKGIQTVEDAQEAVRRGIKAIYLSNHGGRSIDGAPSPLEIAIDIYKTAPEIFKQVEVYADGGIRYGNDVLKLLALGVRAVGLARPFMFANIFGQEGVARAIEILRREIVSDAANLGVADLKKINTGFLDLRALDHGFWARNSD